MACAGAAMTYAYELANHDLSLLGVPPSCPKVESDSIEEPWILSKSPSERPTTNKLHGASCIIILSYHTRYLRSDTCILLHFVPLLY